MKDTRACGFFHGRHSLANLPINTPRSQQPISPHLRKLLHANRAQPFFLRLMHPYALRCNVPVRRRLGTQNKYPRYTTTSRATSAASSFRPGRARARFDRQASAWRSRRCLVLALGSPAISTPIGQSAPRAGVPGRQARRRSERALRQQRLDLGDGLAGIQVLRAGIRTVHDCVAAKHSIGIV